MRTRILLIEDNESFVNSVRLMLRDDDVEIVWAPNGFAGIKEYRKSIHGFATVIIDYVLPDMKGSEVSVLIRKSNPTQDMLFATGHQDSNFLIDLLETGGARSFIAKGRPVDEIRSKIMTSIALYKNQNRVLGLDNYSPSKTELALKTLGLIGCSSALYMIHDKINKYIDLDLPVLITGETGAGKEMVAKALVPAGKKLFVINCARYQNAEQMLESELFGHVKGAFTGADSDKIGLMAQADGQVLFLDELHTLSIGAQEKLLRVLQDGTFRRVGPDSTGREFSAKFRLIVATKPDITERIKDGRFKGDLYYRIKTLPIHIPPLRERQDDIEPLVLHWQNEFNLDKPDHKRRQFRLSTIREMQKQQWPGNVRELKSAVDWMLIHCEGEIVNPSVFAAYLKENGDNNTTAAANISIENSVGKYESDQIINALKQSLTIEEAAQRLGEDRFSLGRRMKRLGINPKPFLLPKTRMKG